MSSKHQIVIPLAFVKMTMIYCSRFEYWSVVIAREFRFSWSLYSYRSHLRRIGDSIAHSFLFIKSSFGCCLPAGSSTTSENFNVSNQNATI